MAPVLESLDFQKKKKDIACFSSIAMLLFLNNYKGKLPMNCWAALVRNLIYHLQSFFLLFILLGNLYQVLHHFTWSKKQKTKPNS